MLWCGGDSEFGMLVGGNFLPLDPRPILGLGRVLVVAFLLLTGLQVLREVPFVALVRRLLLGTLLELLDLRPVLSRGRFPLFTCLVGPMVLKFR